MTKVINMFAGPGAGKSTTAAGLFYKMKKTGKSVELVTEYAKDMVYEERSNIFEDQLYLLAKQNRRIARLNGKVDYIITDSPILLQYAYQKKHQGPCYLMENLTKKLFEKLDNLNILINRTKPYSKQGRNETEEQARELDNIIKEMLIPYSYIQLKDNDEIIEQILKEI